MKEEGSHVPGLRVGLAKGEDAFSMVGVDGRVLLRLRRLRRYEDRPSTRKISRRTAGRISLPRNSSRSFST